MQYNKLIQFLFFIVFFIVYISSVKLNKNKKFRNTISLQQETILDIAYDELMDPDTPLATKIVNFAGENLIGGKLFLGSTSNFFKSMENFRGFKVGSAAGAVVGALELGVKVYEYIFKSRPYGGNFYIHNAVNVPLYLGHLWDYQMNRWHGQFPSVIYQNTYGSAYIETEYCGSKTCEDSNATAEYKLNCNGRDVVFILAMKNRKFFSAAWREGDAYNECYDIKAWGKWNWLERSSACPSCRTYTTLHEGNFSEVLVLASIKSPFINANESNNPELSIKVVPHVVGSRFPVAHDDCNFEGDGLPLVNNNEAGTKNMGDWNDKISSIRIPPGFKIMAFEHENFNGARRLYTSDVKCLVNDNFNDKISSYLVLVDKHLR